MILAVDVYYRDNDASVAGVLFKNWDDQEATAVFHADVEAVDDYQPGSFYLRELPGILSLLAEHQLCPETIIVDGYVYLGDPANPGLGAHLYDALQKRTPIIGVAKNRFKNTPAESELLRGNSQRPLYITSAGVDLDLAKAYILAMHGRHRIPTLLKEADRACREFRPEAIVRNP